MHIKDKTKSKFFLNSTDPTERKLHRYVPLYSTVSSLRSHLSRTVNN